MKPSLKLPDIVLYLSRSTDALISNISKRGRDFEKEISSDYLSKVSAQYESYLKAQTAVPVLFIQSDELDFVKHSEDLLFIMNLLNDQHQRGTTVFAP